VSRVAAADPPADARVTITYCTQCRWLLRASWLAQELLTTFSAEITELVLRPGTGGVLRIEVGETTIFDRATDGGFPDLNVIKRAVRDRIAPTRNLGHIDRVVEEGTAVSATVD
jgi:selenoprotein W-related protein